MDSPHGWKRITYYNSVCRKAQDADFEERYGCENLTNWAEALIELAYYSKFDEARRMIDDAVSKLNSAMLIDPKNPATIFCMGKAKTANAYLTANKKKAKEYFDSAFELYQKAVELNPENERYVKRLEEAEEDADLHYEIHQTFFEDQKKTNGGLMIGFVAVVVVSVAISAWFAFAKARAT